MNEKIIIKEKKAQRDLRKIRGLELNEEDRAYKQP